MSGRTHDAELIPRPPYESQGVAFVNALQKILGSSVVLRHRTAIGQCRKLAAMAGTMWRRDDVGVGTHLVSVATPPPRSAMDRFIFGVKPIRFALPIALNLSNDFGGSAPGTVLVNGQRVSATYGSKT